LHAGGDRAVPGAGAGVEKVIADDGILLLKYWLEVSAGEQTRRLKSRIRDLPLRHIPTPF
jgi:polyphosphate kinase 2 (PPK2 family)